MKDDTGIAGPASASALTFPDFSAPLINLHLQHHVAKCLFQRHHAPLAMQSCMRPPPKWNSCRTGWGGAGKIKLKISPKIGLANKG
jgi:hypothetical protein